MLGLDKAVIRRLVPTVLALLVAAALSGTASAQSPEEQLADRYAPVVRLVAQPEPCEHGEPFEPIDADLVLGNPEVALHGSWNQTAVLKVGPTAKDLSAGLFGYHLDFPGDALHPGCDYENWERHLIPGTKPRTYARVVTEARYPHQLALQYWFFYVYNDWNDKHEGDWEMIQLDFSAGTAAEALSSRPREVGFSQHEGGERADWGSDKLQIVGGTHPVVYPAMGSHANYYNANLWLGRSAAQGVGCDDTVGPSRQLRPEVALFPTAKDAYLAAFPWLGYDGGWGEEHPQFYGGPTGPNTKSQWTEPITWANESWRDSAFAVPAGSSLKGSATDFFCGSVAWGSSVLTKLVAHPGAVVIALAVLLLVLVWLCSRTRWDETEPFRVARRRPWGSLVTASFHLYWRRPWLFLGIGVLFLPLAVLIAGLQYLIFRVGGLEPLVESAGESNAVVAGLAFAIGLFFTIFGLNVVQAVTAGAVVELDAGREITARAAYRHLVHRLPRLLLALCGAVLVITLLSLTGAGILVAAFLLVRWLLLPQVVMVENETVHPLRRSALLVRGHWWRVASVLLFVTLPALAIGPLIGTLMLLLTPASFNVVNLVSGVVYMVTLPFAAIVTTYLYFDVRVREELERDAPAAGGVLPAEIPV
jgi:hypothetical protein